MIGFIKDIVYLVPSLKDRILVPTGARMTLVITAPMGSSPLPFLCSPFCWGHNESVFLQDTEGH